MFSTQSLFLHSMSRIFKVQILKLIFYLDSSKHIALISKFGFCGMLNSAKSGCLLFTALFKISVPFCDVISSMIDILWLKIYKINNCTDWTVS